VLCGAVLCCAVLCCAVLCCAVLCCAVLCCAVLSCRRRVQLEQQSAMLMERNKTLETVSIMNIPHADPRLTSLSGALLYPRTT
jgi:hypothetical protein